LSDEEEEYRLQRIEAGENPYDVYNDIIKIRETKSKMASENQFFKFMESGSVDKTISPAANKTYSELTKVQSKFEEAGIEGNVFLEVPSNFIEYDGNSLRLDSEKYNTYLNEVSKSADSGLNELVSTEYFKTADAEKQKAMIDTVYGIARDEARATVVDNYTYTMSSTKNIKDLRILGITKGDYIAADNSIKGIYGDKDANGKTIQLSASRKKKAAIDKAVPNLTKAQRQKLYDVFDISKKVW
jgi:hypothetical protein